MLTITGGTGRLGEELRKVFPQALVPNRIELDVTNRPQVFEWVRAIRPSVFIHAAAMTDVRAAEMEKDRCLRTNVGGTENLVDALTDLSPDCYFVYVSTACVFAGDRGEYTEEDIPHPKNFYGLTKLLAEYVVRRMKKHLVLRTNFVACEPWPYPRAFTDRFGTYLFAQDVAAGIRDLVDKRELGLVHLAGRQRMSMYELAKLTKSDVDTMTMADVSVPLTVDMTLRSLRYPAIEISGGISTGPRIS